MTRAMRHHTLLPLLAALTASGCALYDGLSAQEGADSGADNNANNTMSDMGGDLDPGVDQAPGVDMTTEVMSCAELTCDILCAEVAGAGACVGARPDGAVDLSFPSGSRYHFIGTSRADGALDIATFTHEDVAIDESARVVFARVKDDGNVTPLEFSEDLPLIDSATVANEKAARVEAVLSHGDYVYMIGNMRTEMGAGMGRRPLFIYVADTSPSASEPPRRLTFPLAGDTSRPITPTMLSFATQPAPYHQSPEERDLTATLSPGGDPVLIANLCKDITRPEPMTSCALHVIQWNMGSLDKSQEDIFQLQSPQQVREFPSGASDITSPMASLLKSIGGLNHLFLAGTDMDRDTIHVFSGRLDALGSGQKSVFDAEDAKSAPVPRCPDKALKFPLNPNDPNALQLIPEGSQALGELSFVTNLELDAVKRGIMYGRFDNGQEMVCVEFEDFSLTSLLATRALSDFSGQRPALSALLWAQRGMGEQATHGLLAVHAPNLRDQSSEMEPLRTFFIELPQENFTIVDANALDEEDQYQVILLDSDGKPVTFKLELTSEGITFID